MPQVLVVGATRGLGASLAAQYSNQSNTIVYGTTRSASGPTDVGTGITWVPHIDVSQENVGASLVNQLGSLGVGGGMSEGGVKAFDVVVCCLSGRTNDDGD